MVVSIFLNLGIFVSYQEGVAVPIKGMVFYLFLGVFGFSVDCERWRTSGMESFKMGGVISV